MLKHCCYAFIFIFEIWTCIMFLESVYHRRVKKQALFIAVVLEFAVLYGISFAGKPLLNLAAFVAVTFLFSLLCYDSGVKSSIFASLMLSVFMLLTETIVVFFSSSVLKIDLTAHQDDMLVLVTQSASSKLLLFVVVFFATRLFLGKDKKHSTDKFIFMLALLPLTSIVILHSLTYSGVAMKLPRPYNEALTICSILLLFSNIFVFYIYTRLQKTHLKITQMSLERQREKISGEYYDLLLNEYEKSRILIHDIKRHLQTIEKTAANEGGGRVVEYVDSIRKDFGLIDRIEYSGSQLVDVIINRYAHRCRESGLNLRIEGRCLTLDFMSDSDITALLDNMFENAVEAAEKSEAKELEFYMSKKNVNFIIIKLINSCDTEPKSKNGKLISSKTDGTYHGVGTKSMKRVVNKYNGDMMWNYSKDRRVFELTIVLQKPSE